MRAMGLGSSKGETRPWKWGLRGQWSHVGEPRVHSVHCGDDSHPTAPAPPVDQQPPPTPQLSETMGPGSHTCPASTWRSPWCSFLTPESRVPGKKPLPCGSHPRFCVCRVQPVQHAFWPLLILTAPSRLFYPFLNVPHHLLQRFAATPSKSLLVCFNCKGGSS